MGRWTGTEGSNDYGSHVSCIKLHLVDYVNFCQKNRMVSTVYSLRFSEKIIFGNKYFFFL